MEYKRIEEVNKRLTPVVIEKKMKNGQVKQNNYNTVNQRILAFRELYPNGSIQTEILSLEDGAVLMKATAFDDDGKIIATGHAREKEGDGFINATSFIENCETSCIGRALGIIGIGAVDALASFQEVANAITQQNQIKEKEDTQKEDTQNEDALLEDLKQWYDKAGGKNFEKWIKDCGGYKFENYGVMKAKLLKQINDSKKGEKA